MKLKLLFFLISVFYFSQESLSLFNDELEGIQYITFNIYYDDNNEFKEVIIDEEKTLMESDTLKSFLKNNFLEFRKYNFDKKDLYMDSLNTIKYKSSSFRFYNNSLKKLKIVNTEKCKRFKLGEFGYRDPIYKKTKIFRYKDDQLEVSNEGYLLYNLNWTSDCTYTLTLKNTNQDKFDFQLNKPIEVEIISLTENGYIYKSVFNEHITLGEINLN